MSYNDIPAGKDLPNDINVVIEIPANHDPIKYEVDKESDAIFVDRFVATPMFLPSQLRVCATDAIRRWGSIRCVGGYALPSDARSSYT